MNVIKYDADSRLARSTTTVNRSYRDIRDCDLGNREAQKHVP